MVTPNMVKALPTLQQVRTALEHTDYYREHIVHLHQYESQSFVLVGTGRGWALIEGYLLKPTIARDCFFKTFWPHFLILGTALPSFALVLISCERFCAVLTPATYNIIFSGQRRAALLATIPLGGLLTVAIGGLSTLGAAGDRIVANHYCAIITSTALW
ncbi:hypothetical protein Y032_0005g2270 [Ancylostoma ceylanicum]|nr:hypothetical protein Y032_0005g2270 [Ancylostoma ceylanicum]